ncbi:hypothetical protein D3P04_05910 [Paracoccus onubensis]|uniref:Uncharacterized protein n=1 Tax=Paracoccus onubensis TaxID=1675788 RepID=A0A418T243_9RHOB|nr:hypothetical protein D3P04_05910 [Paracoccus onubensis]
MENCFGAVPERAAPTISTLHSSSASRVPPPVRARRIEVDSGEVGIMGSKSRLLQTLWAGRDVNPVPIRGLKWRSAKGFERVRFDEYGHDARSKTRARRAFGTLAYSSPRSLRFHSSQPCCPCMNASISARLASSPGSCFR